MNALDYSGAVMSGCGKFRYVLTRRWAEGPVLVYVMLNPSTADHKENDPTIRKCVMFAKAHSYAGLQVVNLFAFRATQPEELALHGWQVGPDNDMHISDTIVAQDVCIAWGAHARRPGARDRAAHVLALVNTLAARRFVLERMPDGVPKHPLFLQNKTRLKTA